MTYQSITNRLLPLISKGNFIIDYLYLSNSEINKDLSKAEGIIKACKEKRDFWYKDVQDVLIENELFLEFGEFTNYSGPSFTFPGIHKKLDDILDFMKTRNSLLIKIAKEIESKHNNKEVIPLTIDDFDNFKEVKNVLSSEVIDFSKNCFLEDDIENAFLEKLGEPYKELDGGAETRDLFSDRIIYKGKRLPTAFMFKGRGERGELTIEKCGSRGNQLLKLSKNNSAECFIVQHGNKINQDVREALQDHILQNTRFLKVYICFIDGVDTARFLKSVGKNLEELKNK